MVESSVVRVTGPLAPFAGGFRAELLRQGYTPRSARDHVYVLAHLSRWLLAQGLEPGSLTEAAVARFLAARRAAGYRRWLSVRSLRALLGYLREAGALPAWLSRVVDGPVEDLLGSYRRYLVCERRLAPSTVRGHEEVARRFLSRRVTGGTLDLDGLASSDVSAFVLAEARLRSVGSMKALVGPLRSLLRFLFLSGSVPRELTAAVPSVASARLVSLPKGVDAAMIAALLSSCDKKTVVGRRDLAILTMMVRLGLRAGEVAALSLDDIDWRAGELMVRGKGGRRDRLPLPADVGQALVDYLRHGRRASACRALFLRACAPDGAMSRGAVVMVPRSASSRAGLSVIVGAHRLRHTAASEMLRAGAPLSEIAQVLRHQSESTTALYAKIDRVSLELCVRAWPEVG
jgi:integrase/recombinase XerD